MFHGGEVELGRIEDTARKPCRIILCEDDEPVRERFARLIDAWPGGRLLATCGDLAQCLRAIRAHEADLLITDLNLPDGNGIAAIRQLRQLHPRAEAMVISVLADDRSVLDSIEAGASGYLLKDADSTDLVEAITDLLDGKSPISSRIARVLIRRLSDRAESGGEDEGERARLTPREMDILWGISKGYTYGELAEQLKISKQTVPVHIRNIYRKLQVRNRSEAIFEATRQGIIRL